MDEIEEIRKALEWASTPNINDGPQCIIDAYAALARLEAREAELTKDRDYWQALAMQFHDEVHAEVERRKGIEI